MLSFNSPKDESFDFKLIVAYTIAVIAFMTAARTYYVLDIGIPILSYMSFTDLVSNTLDVVYGLFWFIAISLLIVLGSHWYIERKVLAFCNSKKGLWVPIVILIVSIILYTIFYCKASPTKLTAWVSKFAVYFGLISGALILKFFVEKVNYNVLAFFLIFTFSFFYMKFVTKVEHKIECSRIIRSVIIFKDNTRGDRGKFTSTDSCYVARNTTDFVFVYHEKDNSFTVYPMSEISSLSVITPPNTSKRFIRKGCRCQ